MAQEFYEKFENDNNFGSWVGKNRNCYIDGGIYNIIKQGSPVALSFDIIELNSRKGGHAVLVPQILKWAANTKLIVWDNNTPYSTKSEDNSELYVPYLQIRRNSNLKNLCLCKVKKTDPASEYFEWNIGINGSQYYLKTDTQNSYGLFPQANIGSNLLRGAAASEKINYDYCDHIKVMLVGAVCDSVINANTNQAVTLVPNGEIVDGQAVLNSTMGGLFNLIYLPKDHKYRISATKLSGIEGVKVFVTIPNNDGSIEKLNYENSQFDGLGNSPEFSFVVGVDNSDTDMVIAGSGTYAPDYQEDLGTAVPAPSSFKGVIGFMGLLFLDWQNPDHPNLTTVKLVRGTDGFPRTPADGILVYEGLDDSYVESPDSGIYYYSAFSVDGNGSFSEPATAFVDTSLSFITGRIVDDNDHGVGGVELRIINGQGSDIALSYSDANGYYAFPNLDYGVYTIYAEKIGFTISDNSRVVAVAERTVEVDFNVESVPAIEFYSCTDSVEYGFSTNFNFSWTYRNIENNAKLKVEFDSGDGWQEIANDISLLNGNYSISKSLVKPVDCKVRISLFDNPEVKVEKEVSVNLGSYAYVSHAGRINMFSVPLYDSIQEVFNDVCQTTEINIAQGDYPENLLFERDRSITISGGWDSSFSGKNSTSIITGSLTINAGTVIVENLVVGGSSSVPDCEFCKACLDWQYGLSLTRNNCMMQGLADNVFDYELGSDGGGYNSGQDVNGVLMMLADCANVDQLSISTPYAIELSVLEPAEGVYFLDGNYSSQQTCSDDVTCNSATGSVAKIVLEPFEVTWSGDKPNSHSYCVEFDSAATCLQYYPVTTNQSFYPSEWWLNFCDEAIPVENRVKVVRTCFSPFLEAAKPLLMIDMPTFIYDPNQVTSGTVVKVRVSLVSSGGICTSCVHELCGCIEKIGVFE